MDSKEIDKTSAEFIPGHSDVSLFSQQALQSVMGAIRASNELPAAGNDYDFYSSFGGFRELMNVEGRRVLQLMQDLLKHQNVKGNLSGGSQSVEVEDKFDVLVDANDQMLERVSSFLDEASGIKKQDSTLVVASVTQKQHINTSWNKKSSESPAQKATSYRLLAARFVQRPQLKFQDKVDNSPNTSFVPKIKHKPNALRSLEESLVPKIIDKTDEFGDQFEWLEYPHPYQYELDQFTPKEEQLLAKEPVPPKSLEDTPLTYVDTTPTLVEMINRLKEEKLIAVDLEHHSYRTYQGITCLMQISTGDHDYVIDTLTLRGDLYLLNEVFTDPGIVKVFHGADMDVEWLQRDLGVYVVNMFDTGQASRVLNLARYSLAYLLQQYCQVEADKQYQLADWRMRPLPDELIKYAREDTHYLLYIYERMKKELIERGNNLNNLLLSVIERSKHICQKTYQKPVFTQESHLELYRKSKKVFNSQQLSALRDLFAWRDGIARLEDESTGYVLPNHMLLQIAEVLPRESQGVIACCNPVPPLLKQYVNEIHQFILAARDRPMAKTEISKKELKPNVSQHPKYRAEHILRCCHDWSWQEKRQTKVGESRVLDPSLVSTKPSMFGDDAKSVIVVKKVPLISALAWDPKEEIFKGATKACHTAASIQKSFSSPFHRYLPADLVKMGDSFAVEEENQARSTECLLSSPRWRLMKNTPKRTAVQENTAVDTQVIQVEEQDITAPIIFQMPSKKRKHSDVDTSLDSSQLEGRKEKGKQKHKKDPKTPTTSEPIQPFDYSKTDYKIFEEKGGKSHKKHYDPNKHHSGKFKGGSKPSLNPRSGKKSMTYTHSNKGHKQGGSKLSWPKR
ncbi:exosome component 10-like [Lingula anatina]|uniref:Exosome complex component 10 homolog n=1 Tax=Lingula anatina TaxID=7574 RepID=A0A1S3K1A2_LINAN|nr:exosome component 10-like [Lingula anatina]|eukprot:XP_013416312.1 exosome component 10-like [Lingula anatina]